MLIRSHTDILPLMGEKDNGQAARFIALIRFLNRSGNHRCNLRQHCQAIEA